MCANAATTTVRVAVQFHKDTELKTALPLTYRTPPSGTGGTHTVFTTTEGSPGQCAPGTLMAWTERRGQRYSVQHLLYGKLNPAKGGADKCHTDSEV